MSRDLSARNEWGRQYYHKRKHDPEYRAKRLERSRSTPAEVAKGYAKKYFKKYPARYLLRTAKDRAKKYGLEFNLEEADFHVPEFCPILGLSLVVASNVRGDPRSASLDRIDNTRGYIKGNVQVISLLANQMKSTANKEQLLRFAEWVKATYGR